MQFYSLAINSIAACPPVAQFFIAGVAVCVTAYLVKKIYDLVKPIFLGMCKDIVSCCGRTKDKYHFYKCDECREYHKLKHPLNFVYSKTTPAT